MDRVPNHLTRQIATPVLIVRVLSLRNGRCEERTAEDRISPWVALPSAGCSNLSIPQEERRPLSLEIPAGHESNRNSTSGEIRHHVRKLADRNLLSGLFTNGAESSTTAAVAARHISEPVFPRKVGGRKPVRFEQR